MKTPYGLMRDVNGNYAINEKEADIVRLVFRLHHIGFSLGKIVDHLEVRNILLPPATQSGLVPPLIKCSKI